MSLGGHVSYEAAYLVKFGKREETVLELKRGTMKPENTKKMKFSYTELECEISYSPTIMLKYDDSHSPSTRIIESICDAFNFSKLDVLFELNERAFSMNNYLPLIPIRKSVIRLMSWAHKLEDINQFYSMYPLQHFSMVTANSNHLGTVPEGSRFFLTQNLILSNIGEIHFSILTGFKGENALFSGSSIHQLCIIEFLRTWMNRDSDNLKTLIVEVVHPIEQHNIFGEMPKIKEEKGVRYPYTSIIKNYYDLPEDAFDCSNAYSITRNNYVGRQKATVKVTQNHFIFFVWD